jgi:hypothetical protein
MPSDVTKNFGRKIMTTADNPDEKGIRELQRIVEFMKRDKSGRQKVSTEEIKS